MSHKEVINRAIYVKAKGKGFLTNTGSHQRPWGWTQDKRQAYPFDGHSDAKKTLKVAHPERIHGVEFLRPEEL